MAPPKVMSGARAIVGLIDPLTHKVRNVGIFNNVSYGLTFDTQPAFILGRFSAAEIDYTAQEPVSITCSGWRVYGHGAHVEAMLPRLQDLLTHEYLSMTIVDRQNSTGKPLARFQFLRPTGFSTTISARNLEEITVTFVGILVDDESTDNEESSTATQLP